jgi:hypothetical protein
MPLSDPIRARQSGIQFFDLDLIKRVGTVLEQLPQWVSPRGPDVARYVDKLSTTAKIVFVASCRVGEEFLSLLNIGDDRALIVPENPGIDTDLYVSAKYAWPAFVAALSRGRTIDQAIRAANDSCVVANPPDIPDEQKKPVCGVNAIVWKKIGGANVTYLGRQ